MAESSVSNEDPVTGKQPRVAAREAIVQEMRRQGTCRCREIARSLQLKESAVTGIMRSLYTQGYARRLGRGSYELVRVPQDISAEKETIDATAIRRIRRMTMPARVILTLQKSPGTTMSFGDINKSTGFGRRATGAVLSSLLKRGVVARPRRGFYRLRHVPDPQRDRAESILRYLSAYPWSRISEIRRGADTFFSADAARRGLAAFLADGRIQCHGFFYALAAETRTPEQCRPHRREGLSAKRRSVGRVGRPATTRKALLTALKSYGRPRTAETLAERTCVSVGGIRAVLSQLVADGTVRAVKMRSDRQDLRLVYHYQYIRPEQGSA